MQIVTKEFLELGVKTDTDINDSQLILLDIDENEKAQWVEMALGKQLSDARAELFVLIGGIKAKVARDRIIKNYKALQKFRLGQHPLDQVRLKSRIGKEDMSIVEQTEKEIQITTSAPSTNGDVTIYCDGGCTPNPGKAGSGVAVYRRGELSELWYGNKQHR